MLAFIEIDRRTDDQVDVIGVRRVRIELRPDQLPLACSRVEHHDWLVSIEGARDVGDRYGPRAMEGSRVVEPWDLGDDLLSGAEAVVAVPLVWADRVARDVTRHVLELEVQPPSGVGG